MRRDVIQALKFGLTMSDEVVAVHVTDDLVAAERLRERFERQVPGVQLVIVESPYRELVQPLIRYLEVTADRDPSRSPSSCSPSGSSSTGGSGSSQPERPPDPRRPDGHPGILVADVPFRRAA